MMCGVFPGEACTEISSLFSSRMPIALTREGKSEKAWWNRSKSAQIVRPGTRKKKPWTALFGWTRIKHSRTLSSWIIRRTEKKNLHRARFIRSPKADCVGWGCQRIGYNGHAQDFIAAERTSEWNRLRLSIHYTWYPGRCIYVKNNCCDERRENYRSRKEGIRRLQLHAPVFDRSDPE